MTDLEKIYKNAPRSQREQLLNFRKDHPPKHLSADGLNWEYLACGNGREALVLLPGGLRTGEAYFRIIHALESEYTIIAPIYPTAAKISQWVEGIRAILDAEGIQQVHIYGTSGGGMLAQCFVRTYPGRTLKLIIGDTTLPDPERGKKYLKMIRIFRLVPFCLIKFFAKRNIPSMVSAIPESDRAFWQAYLTETFDKVFDRDWILASYKIGADYLLNTTFNATDLENWHGKMLIIESDDDTTIGKTQLEALKAAYPQAQTHTFHKAGHAPIFSREKEYIELLRNFLKYD